jgi:hypothetical protein
MVWQTKVNGNKEKGIFIRPKHILDYSKRMGGTDDMDQQLELCPLMHRFIKA